MDIRTHLTAASSRAERCRAEARALLDNGFPSPALVWGVRAAEMFMRDFVLAPHFMEERDDWPTAMRKGSEILWNANQGGWQRAFDAAETWWGPFDEPLTEAGDHAWEFWKDSVVTRRGGVVHGRPVRDVDAEEAGEVLDFVDRMATWYAQRFLTSETHPIAREFRHVLDVLKKSPSTGISGQGVADVSEGEE
jgi:hypothetical protein